MNNLDGDALYPNLSQQFPNETHSLIPQNVGNPQLPMGGEGEIIRQMNSEARSTTVGVPQQPPGWSNAEANFNTPENPALNIQRPASPGHNYNVPATPGTSAAGEMEPRGLPQPSFVALNEERRNPTSAKSTNINEMGGNRKIPPTTTGMWRRGKGGITVMNENSDSDNEERSERGWRKSNRRVRLEDREEETSEGEETRMARRGARARSPRRASSPPRRASSPRGRKSKSNSRRSSPRKRANSPRPSNSRARSPQGSPRRKPGRPKNSLNKVHFDEVVLIDPDQPDRQVGKINCHLTPDDKTHKRKIEAYKYKYGNAGQRGKLSQNSSAVMIRGMNNVKAVKRRL